MEKRSIFTVPKKLASPVKVWQSSAYGLNYHNALSHVGLKNYRIKYLIFNPLTDLIVLTVFACQRMIYNLNAYCSTRKLGQQFSIWHIHNNFECRVGCDFYLWIKNTNPSNWSALPCSVIWDIFVVPIDTGVAFDTVESPFHFTDMFLADGTLMPRFISFISSPIGRLDVGRVLVAVIVVLFSSDSIVSLSLTYQSSQIRWLRCSVIHSRLLPGSYSGDGSSLHCLQAQNRSPFRYHSQNVQARIKIQSCYVAVAGLR